MWSKILIFLVVTIVISLSTLTASAQAEEQKTHLSVVEKKIVIIYGSRYGSTEQTAKWIAEGMEGKAEVIAALEAEDLTTYDKVILGSGIYGGQLHQDILAFLTENKGEVNDKIVALFVVCGSPASYAQGYLDMFAERCEVKPALMKAFRGWQKKELLSPEDYKILENYYKSVNQPFVDYDHTDKTKCIEFGKEILDAI